MNTRSKILVRCLFVSLAAAASACTPALPASSTSPVAAPGTVERPAPSPAPAPPPSAAEPRNTGAWIVGVWQTADRSESYVFTSEPTEGGHQYSYASIHRTQMDCPSGCIDTVITGNAVGAYVVEPGRVALRPTTSPGKTFYRYFEREPGKPDTIIVRDEKGNAVSLLFRAGPVPLPLTACTSDADCGDGSSSRCGMPQIDVARPLGPWVKTCESLFSLHGTG